MGPAGQYQSRPIASNRPLITTSFNRWCTAPLLASLEQQGVEMTSAWRAMNNMAACALADPAFNTADLCKDTASGKKGLTTRMEVFTSPLYFDFIDQRTKALLSAARTAASKERRQQLLCAAEACHASTTDAVSEATVVELGHALALFGASASSASALGYAMEDLHRVDFAQSFKV